MRKSFSILLFLGWFIGLINSASPAFSTEFLSNLFSLKENKAKETNITSNFTSHPTKVSFVQHPLPSIIKTKGIYEPYIYQLKNGLQVAIITNKRSPVVKQYVFYRVGSMDDPLGKTGIAHFLEHLMFLGGTKYLGPKQFDKVIDRLGAEKNAYTTYDHTAYYEEAPKEGLEEIIKVEAGRMEQLDLTENLVLPERDVILEERNMRLDNEPEALMDEAIRRALFQNHPFGWPVIGWKNEMQGLTLKDAQDFHYHWYCPNNAIVVIAGDVTVEEVKPFIDKYYAPIAARPIKVRNNMQEPQDRGVRVRLRKESERVKQPMFQRIYKTSSLSYGDTREVFPLRVCAYILSNGQNSKLYQYFVKKKKLATQVSFGNMDALMGPGVAAFSILPASDKSVQVIEKELEFFIKELLEKGLTNEEVEQAKERMLATFDYARDTVFSGANAIGSALVRGRSIDEIEHMPAYLKAVTSKDVNFYMKELLSRKDYMIAELLPLPILEKSPERKKQ